jgi:alpha-1,6-mannosyltransferase
MACARPVVSLHGGALAELIGNGVGVIAAGDDAAALADAVRELYARDRAAMSALARQRVARDYLWEHTLPRQLARYAELARVADAAAPATVAEAA